MTREEAYNRIDAIIEKHEVDDVYITITNHKDYDALRMAREALEQEPCEDCISRQAVLEKMAYTETEEGWSGMTVNVKDIEALPSVTPAEKAGRWIPVSDRLPGNDDDVLVWDGYNNMVAWYIGGEWHSSDECFNPRRPVKYWMPLPEPYKESEEV